ADHAANNGDETNATLTQYSPTLTDIQIDTTHAAHVLDTQILPIPGFNLLHHCQKSGTVKASTTNAIVRQMDNVCKALPCGELLQHCFLETDLSRGDYPEIIHISFSSL